MTWRRGDLVSVLAAGEYTAKARPALIVQSSEAVALRDSVTVCLLTGELIEAPAFRVRIKPERDNGLRKTSDVMIDKLITIPKSAIVGSAFGKLSLAQLKDVDRALRFWLNL